jgi:DNA-binding NarL/FixJ family response regulator
MVEPRVAEMPRRRCKPDYSKPHRHSAGSGFAGGVAMIAAAHILLYDLATARQDGPSQLMSLHAKLPQARILMFNVMDDDQAIIECVRVGASGCVLQDATLDDLVAAIRSVAQGTPHSSPQVITSLFSYVASLQAGEDRLPPSNLTPREEQILQLLAEGLSNKRIEQQGDRPAAAPPVPDGQELRPPHSAEARPAQPPGRDQALPRQPAFPALLISRGTSGTAVPVRDGSSKYGGL